MIFGLMRVMRTIPAPKGGIEASEAKPLPVHGVVVGALVVCGVVTVVAMMASGGPSNVLIWGFAVLASLLITGSLFVRGASEYWQQHANPPAPATGSNPDTTAQVLRERAAAIEQEEVTAKTAPTARPASLPFEWPKREFVSPGMVKDDHELQERLLRVAAILVAPCPECSAEEAEFCTVVGDDPSYMLDRERSIWVHGRRIGHAVKIGAARVTDVVAQFNGNEHVPAEVWEEAL